MHSIDAPYRMSKFLYKIVKFDNFNDDTSHINAYDS